MVNLLGGELLLRGLLRAGFEDLPQAFEIASVGLSQCGFACGFQQNHFVIDVSAFQIQFQFEPVFLRVFSQGVIVGVLPQNLSGGRSYSIRKIMVITQLTRHSCTR